MLRQLFEVDEERSTILKVHLNHFLSTFVQEKFQAELWLLALRVHV